MLLVMIKFSYDQVDLYLEILTFIDTLPNEIHLN